MHTDAKQIAAKQIAAADDYICAHGPRTQHTWPAARPASELPPANVAVLVELADGSRRVGHIVQSGGEWRWFGFGVTHHVVRCWWPMPPDPMSEF